MLSQRRGNHPIVHLLPAAAIRVTSNKPVNPIWLINSVVQLHDSASPGSKMVHWGYYRDVLYQIMHEEGMGGGASANGWWHLTGVSPREPFNLWCMKASKIELSKVSSMAPWAEKGSTERSFKCITRIPLRCRQRVEIITTVCIPS